MKTDNTKLHGTSSSGKRTKSSQMFILPAAYGSSKSGRHFLSPPSPYRSPFFPREFTKTNNKKQAKQMFSFFLTN
jgi:hypothetical protein